MTRPVTYATAVKAKEKGFDKEIGSYYDLEYDPWKYSEPQLYDMARKQDWNKTDERVSAPSLSDLSKWLREEKGIHVIACPRTDNKGWFWQYTKLDHIFYVSELDVIFPTHDLAFEAGLLKALELV
jgi:hypothetical protein